jgi:hypothetical protein
LFELIGDFNQDGRDDFKLVNHPGKDLYSEVWVSVEGGWSRMTTDSGGVLYVGDLDNLSNQGYFITTMVPSSTSSINTIIEVIPGTSLTRDKYSLFTKVSQDSIYHELRDYEKGSDSTWWSTTWQDFDGLGLLPFSQLDKEKP